MALFDMCFDPEARLVSPPDCTQQHKGAPRIHMVRESSWYAVGLLLRDGKGDRARAVDVLDAVLSYQYHEPGAKHDATFHRYAEEDPSRVSSQDHPYDSNLREFIGVTFALIVSRYADKVPSSLRDRLEVSIKEDIAGEINEQRLTPDYTNIALLYVFLLDFAGHRYHNADWARAAGAWEVKIFQRFEKGHTFDEYNSPTYYGTDLFALSLWRVHGSTPELQNAGASMEAELWKDIAAFYNPSLRNMSGPYDRAYGMDMTSYVSIVGLCIGFHSDPNSAPLPVLASSADHAIDIFFVPLLAAVETEIPTDVLKRLATFQGDRLLTRQLPDERLVTTWIGRKLMYGGEVTGWTRDAGRQSRFPQFRPATAHWLTRSGKTGWLAVTESPPIDAVADKEGLTIMASGAVRFQISVPSGARLVLRANTWELPDLTVTIDSDQDDFKIDHDGRYTYATYTGLTKLRLTFIYSDLGQ